MNINKTKLFENFANFKNIANVNILKCYDNLLDKKGIIKNVGFYVISFIIILHSISVFIFYCVQKYQIKKRINKILDEIKAHSNMIKLSRNHKTSIRNLLDNIIETNNKNNINNKRKKNNIKKKKEKE
jgi:hypothetical protein